MTYKISNGVVLADKEYNFTMNTSYSLDLMDLRFIRKLTRLQHNFYIFWNSLPYEIATSPNVLSFKTNLDPFFV